jgi:hypothetical protein
LGLDVASFQLRHDCCKLPSLFIHDAVRATGQLLTFVVPWCYDECSVL